MFFLGGHTFHWQWPAGRQQQTEFVTNWKLNWTCVDVCITVWVAWEFLATCLPFKVFLAVIFFSSHILLWDDLVMKKLYSMDSIGCYSFESLVVNKKKQTYSYRIWSCRLNFYKFNGLRIRIKCSVFVTYSVLLH